MLGLSPVAGFKELKKGKGVEVRYAVTFYEPITSSYNMGFSEHAPLAKCSSGRLRAVSPSIAAAFHMLICRTSSTELCYPASRPPGYPRGKLQAGSQFSNHLAVESTPCLCPYLSLESPVYGTWSMFGR